MTTDDAIEWLGVVSGLMLTLGIVAVVFLKAAHSDSDGRPAKERTLGERVWRFIAIVGAIGLLFYLVSFAATFEF